MALYAFDLLTIVVAKLPIGPARAAHLRPAVKVGAVPAHIDHAVDRARSAEQAPARDTAAWDRLARLYSPLVDRWCRQAGLDVLRMKGLQYNPLTQRYWLSEDTSVNYMVACRKG